MRAAIARALTVVLIATVGACGDNELRYDLDWDAGDVLSVVSRSDGLVLVGVNPDNGRVRTMAKVDTASADPNGAQEANVLRADGKTWLVVTDGTSAGTLYRVDFGAHVLHRETALGAARLPVLAGAQLGAVAAITPTDFRLHVYALAEGGGDRQHELAGIPIASSGECLVTATYGGDSRILFYGRTLDPDVEPVDVGYGIPGGVACADGVGVVSVSSTSANTNSRQLTAGDHIVVLRNRARTLITVGSQPARVAIDGAAEMAAVEVETSTGRGVALVDLTTGAVTRTMALPGGSQVTGMALRGTRLIAFTDDQVLVMNISAEGLLNSPLPGSPIVGQPG